MTRRQLIRLVRRLAPRMGLDARAVLAVGHAESGLRPRAVGDRGTSFGPWQLHRGGALPAGKGLDWAASPAGVRYALAQMAKVARGLEGAEAVDAIVRKFERPADPDGEIRRALSVYGQMPSGVGGGSSGRSTGFGGRRARRKAARSLFGALQLAVSGGDLQRAWALLIRGASQYQALSWGGDIDPPNRWLRDGAPRSASPTINRALAVAHSQLGKPYVWGGESPAEGGFDCSGLIDFSLRQAGIDLPGRLTTYSAMKIGRSVKGKRLRPGDLIITNKGRHMVWYVGDGRVIAAPRRGEVVQYQPLSRFSGDIVDIRRLPI